MSFDPIPLEPTAAPSSPNALFRPVPVSGIGTAVITPEGVTVGGVTYLWTQLPPVAPSTGEYTLTSTDGVLSWEAV